MMHYFAQASLDLNEAWNMSWGEGVQFLLILTFLYWVKKRIDLNFAKKQAKTTIYRVRLEDTDMGLGGK